MVRKSIKHLSLMLLSALSLVACGSETGQTETGPAQTEIGATGPGGGVIIYVDTAGFPCGETLEETCTYLEVAPADSQVERRWSGDDKELVGVGADPATKQKSPHHLIGAGENNSKLIAASAGAGDAQSSAAVYALAYTTPGADDWFLPSIEELAELYEQRSIVDGVRGDSYWSSTEGTAIDAWGIHFESGVTSTNFKWRDKTYYVRPMRAG